MGSYLSRNNDRVETIQDDSSLTFPPTTGNLFSFKFLLNIFQIVKCTMFKKLDISTHSKIFL